MSLCEGRGKRRTLSLKTGGVVKPYMDSVLRHNKKRYLTFLRQLLSGGMLNFVEWAKTLAGVFFCVEVVEDKATVYYRRETRKHVLQGSSFGGLVLFGDFVQDRD